MPANAHAFRQSDCDDSDFQTVLHPNPFVQPAQGIWLNKRLIQWPGEAKGGRYRLYYAANAQLRVENAQPVVAAQGHLDLQPYTLELPDAIKTRFAHVAKGVVLDLGLLDFRQISRLHQNQLVLVEESDSGQILRSTHLQNAGALDDLFASAASVNDLGVTLKATEARFALWAPTARQVAVCVYDSPTGAARVMTTLIRDDATGIWSATSPGKWGGQYYQYLVDVVVPGVGQVRNRVTDPYSISLASDSRRSYIGDLDSAALKPAGWLAKGKRPAPISSTDMVIYELHVRDFSASDESVPAKKRGKFLAFTEPASHGVRHLMQLANAGLTDVHLLPVFDFATVPESDCVTPTISGEPDSESQQSAVQSVADRDCFNWGYDPLHYGAPEGSYASNAADGAVRIREFRQMVQALHQLGLRVGMDVVYNHTSAAGQHPRSVLDRIVPGYYHRLSASGDVEQSTCGGCGNTATENRMMAKLMTDTVVRWAKHYAIDSFRFDLMGHQPRDVMLALQKQVDQAAGRHINLIGEGWNFGEVANGSRFVQASQRSLGGSGIATFSDRARDAIRGGSPGDQGAKLVENQGYINGLSYDPNREAPTRDQTDLMRLADQVRLGLAGSLQHYAMMDYTGKPRLLKEIDYNGQPGGYADEPDEVVNYVENHDNHTLFDNNVFKLPMQTSSAERARVQMLGVALNAFSQGVAYFHAGIDTLRSKSMDANSYDSGDWFNRLDWSGKQNNFAVGLPPKRDNESAYPWIKPRLASSHISPDAKDIAFAKAAFRDFLAIRASSSLFRLRTALDIRQRLHFPNSGPAQNPLLMVGHLNGRGYPGAHFDELLYGVNVGTSTQTLTLPEQAGKRYRLHPVLRRVARADARVSEAKYDATTGAFSIPARTAVVFVLEPDKPPAAATPPATAPVTTPRNRPRL